jgi:ParB-like chromosome segregation protein Spo0J
MPIAIQYVSPESLRPAPWNPRTISKDNLRRLADALDAHGFVTPIVARRGDRLVLGGHQRLAANALRARPAESVPVIFLDDIDDRRAKALNIALNSADAQGRFDAQALGDLLAEINSQLEADLADLSRLTAMKEADLELLLRSREQLEPICALENDAEPLEHDVLVVFEIPRDRFEQLRGPLDDFIQRYDVKAVVR